MQLYFLSIIISIFISNSFAITCKDRSGNDVDWWVSLKIPTTTADTIGKHYTYYDSTMTSNTWVIGTNKIDDLTV